MPRWKERKKEMILGSDALRFKPLYRGTACAKGSHPASKGSLTKANMEALLSRGQANLTIGSEACKGLESLHAHLRDAGATAA